MATYNPYLRQARQKQQQGIPGLQSLLGGGISNLIKLLGGNVPGAAAGSLANLGGFLGGLTGTPVGKTIGSVAGGGLGSLITGSPLATSLAGLLNAFSGKEAGGQMLASALTPAFASMLGGAGAGALSTAAAPTLSSILQGITPFSSALGPISLALMPIFSAIMGATEKRPQDAMGEAIFGIGQTGQQNYQTLRNQIAQQTGISPEYTYVDPFAGWKYPAVKDMKARQPDQIDTIIEQLAKQQGWTLEKSNPQEAYGWTAGTVGSDYGFIPSEWEAIQKVNKDYITGILSPQEAEQKTKLLKQGWPMTYSSPAEIGYEEPAFVMGGGGA